MKVMAHEETERQSDRERESRGNKSQTTQCGSGRAEEIPTVIDMGLGHTDEQESLPWSQYRRCQWDFQWQSFFCVVIELIIICVFSIVLRERWMHVRKKDLNSKPLYSPQNTFEQF